MLFSTRAVYVSIFGMYNHLLPDYVTKGPIKECLLVLGLIIISLAVDKVTEKYGTAGITAVRNDADGSLIHLRLFYSYYQFLAQGSHVSMDKNLCDLGFNGLIAIQSSAFLMTLKRKSLIRLYSHAFWYTLALLLSVAYMIKAKGWFFLFMVMPVFFVRVKYNMPKYGIWMVYIFVTKSYMWLPDLKFFQQYAHHLWQFTAMGMCIGYFWIFLTKAIKGDIKLLDN